MRTILLVYASMLTAAVDLAGRDLEAYFIDVEGGKATLVVAPSGETLLIDAGYDGFNNRDADRIRDAARGAGVGKVDYLVITHYHGDHVGGVRQLSARLPILNFLDHGPNVEEGQSSQSRYRTYEQVASKGKRIRVKPGDTIPLQSLQVRVVAAGGEVLALPLAGAGQRNPECANLHRDYSGSENAQSVGLLVTYSAFQLLDLGDLGGDNERQLVCPANKIGPVTVFVVSHHGNDDASSPSLVHALRPKVAIMPNGATKGGAPRTFETLRKTPSIEDIWQLHYSLIEPRTQNVPLAFIANPDQNCKGKWLKLTAHADGSFTVYNAGNQFQKAYGPK
jgi:beta-lactamase superfamily II metal-dependent hydrolase